MRRLCLYTAALVTGSACVSCSGDDDADNGGIPQTAVYDFATLETAGSKGSTFTLCKSDDSPLLTYFANVDMTKSEIVKVGDRLIICYNRIDGATYSSGNIKLYGYATLAGTRPQVVTDDSASVFISMPQLPLHVSAMWRSGHYLNVIAGISLTRAQRPVKYVLAADPATLDEPVPDLRLVYCNAEGNDGLNLYTVNASFDMSPLWNDPRYTALRIVYDDKDGPQSLTLTKP